MRRFAPITLLAIAAITPSASLIAEDFRVKSAAALDGKVQCFAHTSDWVTASTGPCDSFTSPPKVALGERFTANGDERQIGVIVATQAEEDMHENGLDIRKGEWTCVAAENSRKHSLGRKPKSKFNMALHSQVPAGALNAPLPPTLDR